MRDERDFDDAPRLFEPLRLEPLERVFDVLVFVFELRVFVFELRVFVLLLRVLEPRLLAPVDFAFEREPLAFDFERVPVAFAFEREPALFEERVLELRVFAEPERDFAPGPRLFDDALVLLDAELLLLERVPLDLGFDDELLLFEREPEDFDFERELDDFVSPCWARVLLTVRAAITSARPSGSPFSCSDSFTCAY